MPYIFHNVSPVTEPFTIWMSQCSCKSDYIGMMVFVLFQQKTMTYNYNKIENMECTHTIKVCHYYEMQPLRRLD